MSEHADPDEQPFHIEFEDLSRRVPEPPLDPTEPLHMQVERLRSRLPHPRPLPLGEYLDELHRVAEIPDPERHAQLLARFRHASTSPEERLQLLRMYSETAARMALLLRPHYMDPLAAVHISSAVVSDVLRDTRVEHPILEIAHRLARALGTRISEPE